MGTYNDEARQEACRPCPAGSFQNEYGQTGCRACLLGSFCPLGTSTPLPCPPGTYSNRSGLELEGACVTSPPGFASALGSGWPTPCPLGFYANSPGQSECTPCAEGTFQDSIGQTTCVLCQPGFWCSAKEAVSCPKDTYNPKDGQTSQVACRSCPGNSITRGLQGQTGVAACLCKVGYYEYTGNQTECRECPAGSECSTPGTVLRDLPIKRGYFRLSLNSSDVRRCPDAATNCSDDSSECLGSTSGCRGTAYPSTASATGCHPTLWGPFCQLCNPSLGQDVYYVPAQQSEVAKCKACEETLTKTAVIAIAGAVGVVCGGCLLHLFSRLCLSPRHREQLAYAWKRFNPGVKLKILIAFYQIATKVEMVYQVEMPVGVKRLLARFSVIVSLGFSVGSTPLQCIGLGGYFNLLLASMILPVAIVIVIVLVSVVVMLFQRRCSGRVLVGLALPWILKFLFLVYPIVTNVAFMGFPCYTFEEDGSKYLKADVGVDCCVRADVGVDCKDHTYEDEILPLAWVAIGIYPIGLIILNAVLLFCARKAIMSGRQTPLRRATEFLHKEFEPHLFWWEIVEMLRRLLLVGLMLMVYEGQMLQIMLGTIAAAILLFFQVQAAPYNDIADDYLASGASFSLLILFLCSIGFKFALLTDNADVWGKMSKEQRHIYGIPVVTLSIIVVLSIIASLAMSAVLFLVQLTQEGARMRREALMKKARRLRQRANHAEVTAPKIDVQGYHVFLSHVWGTGQDQMRIIKQRLLEMIPGLSVFLDVDDRECIATHLRCPLCRVPVRILPQWSHCDAQTVPPQSRTSPIYKPTSSGLRPCSSFVPMGTSSLRIA